MLYFCHTKRRIHLKNKIYEHTCDKNVLIIEIVLEL